MLKVKIQLRGVAQALHNLERIDEAIKRTYIEELYKAAVKLRDCSKEILDQSVNPQYSTGKLSDSIKVTFNPNEPSARVGPDMRIAPYAEWVEFGHFMRDGRWWSGHHYMERGLAETQDEFFASLKAALANTLKHYEKGGIPRGPLVEL